MKVYRDQSFIRPDLQAHLYSERLLDNVRALRGLCAPTTRFCAVVKANAYGHGIREVVNILKNGPVDFFAVATFYEALHIRPLVHRQSILILEPIHPAQPAEQIRACAAAGFHCVLASLEGLDWAGKALAGTDRILPVHLNIETGMGRCGMPPEEAAVLLTRLRSQTMLRLAGVFTHYATADEDDISFAWEQHRRFETFLQEHRLKDRPDLLIHSCNSAATLKMPPAHYTMVRCGISMYGYYSRPTSQPPICLKPVLKLQAPLTLIKKIKAGESVGYGRSFLAKRDTLAAIVPLGYADGYRRAFSNKAVMKLGDRFIPVIGRVCMDQLIVDVTDVPNVQTGQMVTVIDDDHQSPCGVYALAELADTICYEILTMIHAHVNRIVH
ncbi:MAG TPA: alanine racemase [Anaerohalosphaeraceae bacterium]|nr:alanine racemase [Anaerohalosphaeraceae bacterium]HOL88659.1 alanine racemase [Anaerohalosphaeraceae bacterium]HPP57060.1 alanine racemase [Anaerohalosphaeraceae bacterium]